jgi:hypothetical protein
MRLSVYQKKHVYHTKQVSFYFSDVLVGFLWNWKLVLCWFCNPWALRAWGGDRCSQTPLVLLCMKRQFQDKHELSFVQKVVHMQDKKKSVAQLCWWDLGNAPEPSTSITVMSPGSCLGGLGCLPEAILPRILKKRGWTGVGTHVMVPLKNLWLQHNP